MRWVGWVAVLGLTLAGCGSSKTKTATPATTIAPTTTTQSAAEATAEITATWEKYFNEHTTVDEAVQLLQNGEKHRAFRQMSVDKGQTKGTGAKVEKVEFEDANTAVVTFALLINGAVIPSFAHATGRAVRVGGKWLVSEEYNCSLEALGNNGNPPADCKP
jgi:hypothetical protein